MFRKCEQTCETFCDNVIPFLHLILVKLHYQHFFCFFKRHFQDINIQGFCCGFGSFQSNLDSQTKIRWKALKSQKKLVKSKTFYEHFLSSVSFQLKQFSWEYSIRVPSFKLRSLLNAIMRILRIPQRGIHTQLNTQHFWQVTSINWLIFNRIASHAGQLSMWSLSIIKFQCDQLMEILDSRTRIFGWKKSNECIRSPCRWTNLNTRMKKSNKLTF